MKIVVLAGGLSPERNVSLSSGAMVCEALRSKGHQVALVDLFFGMEGTDQTVDPFQAPIPQAFKRSMKMHHHLCILCCLVNL